ncbi:MAG: retention module-containing protein, partial [Desulfobulbaceae bacterium]
MADNVSGTGGPGSAAPVGKVFVIFGEVKAIAPDGTVRLLAPNNPVFADERVVTGGDGRISITFNDTEQTVLTLGRSTDVVINEDVYGQEPPDDFSDVAGEVADIQQALEEGDFDPTTEFEPTAAGPAAGGPGGVASARDGGASYPVFILTGEEVIPDSGAET